MKKIKILFVYLKLVKYFIQLIIHNFELTEIIIKIQYLLLDLEKLQPTECSNYLERAYSNSQFNRDWIAKYVPPVVNLSELSKLPRGTFGYEYARFLTENNLSDKVFSPIKTTDQLSYLITRMERTHDYRHVIFGYSTSVFDEIGLQGFVLGHFKTSLPGILFGLVFIATALKKPAKLEELVEKIYGGCKQGAHTQFFLNYRWEDYFELPLEDLRKMVLGNQLVTA